jgi:hypothetical protein
VIAVRHRVQEHGLGTGKARVPHNCPHGRPCIAGIISQGFNTNSKCDDCIRERRHAAKSKQWEGMK